MIIEVVGAVIRDVAGRVLVVRKRQTGRFMLPGGKREPGEDDLAALRRELAEELDVRLVFAELLGRFEAPAANEPGATVRSCVYLADTSGAIRIGGEIEQLAWLDPEHTGELPLAPLLSQEVLPSLIAAWSATRGGSR